MIKTAGSEAIDGGRVPQVLSFQPARRYQELSSPHLSLASIETLDLFRTAGSHRGIGVLDR